MGIVCAGGCPGRSALLRGWGDFLWGHSRLAMATNPVPSPLDRTRGSVAERSKLNSDCKSTFIGDGGNIAGTMQDADDDDFVGPWKVIDRVLLIEDNAQIR